MTALDLTQELFAETLQSAFTVHTSSGATVELELVAMHEGRASPGHEAFSLTFRGPLDAFLGQGLFGMAHDTLGEFDLFIVPVGQTPDGFLYEAVFNR